MARIISPNSTAQMSDTDMAYFLHESYTEETGEYVAFGTFSAIREFIHLHDKAVKTNTKAPPSRTAITGVPYYIGALLYSALCFLAGAFHRFLFACVRRVLALVTAIVLNLAGTIFVVFVMWAIVEAMVRAAGGDVGSLGIWRLVATAAKYVLGQVKLPQQEDSGSG